MLTVPIVTAQAQGLALLWLALQARSPGEKLIPVLTDGEMKLWHPENVYFQSSPSLDPKTLKPRFLAHGTTPVDLFGCPYSRHFEPLEVLLDAYGMKLQPHHHYGEGWLASTYKPDDTYRDAFGYSPMQAALRCVAVAHFGAEAQVPHCIHNR